MNDVTNPPEKYWHCKVQLHGDKKYAVVNDLTFAGLERTILAQWRAGRTFTVSGVLVQSRNTVKEIKITQTDQPQRYYADQYDNSMSRSNFVDMASDRRLLPLSKGKDWTFDLLLSDEAAQPPEPDVAMVERLCSRLPQAARALTSRGRSKASFLVEDEYDVQDLLYAALRAYLKYTVLEDPMGKIANVKAGRADISIEELGVLIEVKFARQAKDQKRILEEYSEDLVLYAKWPHLKRLIFLIYNSTILRDGEAFDKLSGPQVISGRHFEVSIILA